MPRNPLAVGHLTTADLIAETRLKDADVSPDDRVRVARAIARAMTPAERAAIADRNRQRMSMAELRVTTADIAVNGPGAALAARKGRGK